MKLTCIVSSLTQKAVLNEIITRRL